MAESNTPETSTKGFSTGYKYTPAENMKPIPIGTFTFGSSIGGTEQKEIKIPADAFKNNQLATQQSSFNALNKVGGEIRLPSQVEARLAELDEIKEVLNQVDVELERDVDGNIKVILPPDEQVDELEKNNKVLQGKIDSANDDRTELQAEIFRLKVQKDVAEEKEKLAKGEAIRLEAEKEEAEEKERLERERSERLAKELEEKNKATATTPITPPSPASPGAVAVVDPPKQPSTPEKASFDTFLETEFKIKNLYFKNNGKNGGKVWFKKDSNGKETRLVDKEYRPFTTAKIILFDHENKKGLLESDEVRVELGKLVSRVVSFLKSENFIKALREAEKIKKELAKIPSSLKTKLSPASSEPQLATKIKAYDNTDVDAISLGKENDYRIQLGGNPQAVVEKGEWASFLNTFATYRNFIRKDNNKTAYPKIIEIKNSLVDAINAGDLDKTRTLKDILERGLTANGATAVSSPTRSTPVQVATTPKLENKQSSKEMFDKIYASNPSFWTNTNKTKIWNEYINIMEIMNYQPEYKYNVTLKYSDRTKQYYWDISVPERNLHETKTAFERKAGGPDDKDWRNFLRSLRDRAPEDIKTSEMFSKIEAGGKTIWYKKTPSGEEPVLPNPEITDSEWKNILLVLEEYRKIMNSKIRAQVFPELIDLKNKILTAIDNKDYTSAKEKTGKLKEAIEGDAVKRVLTTETTTSKKVLRPTALKPSSYKTRSAWTSKPPEYVVTPENWDNKVSSLDGTSMTHAEWVAKQDQDAERKKQTSAIEKRNSSLDLELKHHEMYQKDPAAYRQMYENKTFLPDDPNKEIVKRVLDSSGELANLKTYEQERKEARDELANRDNYLRATSQNFSPIVKGVDPNEQARANSLAAEEARLGRIAHANEGSYTHISKVPLDPNIKQTKKSEPQPTDKLVSPINKSATNAVEKEKRVGASNKLLSTLSNAYEKVGGNVKNNWRAYALAAVTVVALGGIAKMATSDKNSSSLPPVATAPAIPSGEAAWTQEFKILDENKEILKNFMDFKSGTMSADQFMELYMPKSSFTADSFQVFNQPSGIVPQTIDENNKDHRISMSKFISDLVKIRQAIIKHNNQPNKVYTDALPLPKTTMKELLELTKNEALRAT